MEKIVAISPGFHPSQSNRWDTQVLNDVRTVLFGSTKLKPSNKPRFLFTDGNRVFSSATTNNHLGDSTPFRF